MKVKHEQKTLLVVMHCPHVLGLARSWGYLGDDKVVAHDDVLQGAPEDDASRVMQAECLLDHSIYVGHLICHFSCSITPMCSCSMIA